MRKLMALTIAFSCAAMALSLTDLLVKSKTVKVDVVHWGQIKTDKATEYVGGNHPGSINITQKVWSAGEADALKGAVAGMQHKETRPPFPGPTPILMASPACRPQGGGRDMMVPAIGEEKALLAAAKQKY